MEWSGMSFRSPLFVLVVLLAVGLLAGPRYACAETESTSATLAVAGGAGAAPAAAASLQGRVVDSAGAPLSGVRVVVEAAEVADGAGTRGARRATTVSGADGRFTVRLAAGAYVVRVGIDGLAEAALRVAVEAGRTTTQDFVLPLAALEDSITVHAQTGYSSPPVSSATRTLTPVRDVPQSITVVTRQLMQDQLMTSIGDVVRYVPGVTLHQGENNRDQVIVRGNSSSADFFVDGIRDDVQYYRDLYNLERVEALKGPNAMIFGRGGGGGVINRVTKEAMFGALREISLQGGSESHQRVAADFDQSLGEHVALRLNGMYEDSGSFREGVDLQRSGVAPTLTYAPTDATRFTLGYEHFRDRRVADRGISSYRGRPADVDVSTYYGNPDDSRVRAVVDLGSLGFEHRFGSHSVRSRTLFGDYDRFYQNYVPGAVSADGSRVLLTAYNNATRRQNVFNQTDLVLSLGRSSAGTARHTVVVGAEVGRQATENFRNTGFFDNATTSISVPFGAPTITTPVTFRQNATDADNQLRANVAALYAQDQIALSERVQLIAGLRVDRFDLAYENRRNGDRLSRVDDLVSPRAGIVVKPVRALSLYGTYSVSHLPSSGDQFSSLTVVTEQVEPERFTNYEIGAKWEASDLLSVTTAVYRLDRTHTRALDPNDPTRIVQTGSQRTSGFELGVNGRLTDAWSVAGGYAYQDAEVTSATVAARAGARVAQVPRHTLSLWNNYQVRPRLGAALGVVCRSAMFAAIDNTVTLPGYARLDAALFVPLTKDLRVQLNVENLLNAGYYANADSNTNITPGSPRAVRIGLSAKF